MKVNVSTLRIPIPLTITLDPHRMEDLYSMFVCGQVHSSLYKYNSSGDIENDIAESSNFIKEKKELEIKIRNLTFSDGSPITALHVVNSLKRPFKKQSSIAADLNYIVGYEDAIKGEDTLSISAKNADTIVIRLQYETDFIFKHLALPDLAILKIEGINDDLPNTNVTSGNYFVQQLEPQSVVLKKSTFRADAGGPETVVFTKMDLEELKMRAMSGSVDTTEFYQNIGELEVQLEKLHWKKIVAGQSYENFLILNPSKISRNLRNEIYNFIASEKFQKFLLQCDLTAAFGLVPPNIPGAITKQVLLEEEQNQPAPHKFKIVYSKANLSHNKIALKLGEELRLRGHTIEVGALELDDFYEILFKKKADAIIAGKGLDYPDAYGNLSYFITDISNNFLFMENESLNSEIRNLTKLESIERLAKYREVQLKILNQKTVMPLFFGTNFSSLWSPRVSTVPSHPFGIQFLKLSDF